MSAQVHDIWKHGPACCLRCLYVWHAVRPASALALECPACGAARGYGADELLAAPRLALGDECCGQKDSADTCVAPACLMGDALKAFNALRLLLAAERSGPPPAHARDDAMGIKGEPL
jgi:hypothetical protein